MLAGRLREVRKEGSSQWRSAKRESGKERVQFKQGGKIAVGGRSGEYGVGAGRPKGVRGYRSHKWSDTEQSGCREEAGPGAERALTRHRAIGIRNMA
jgi:hypothetical protein